MIPELGQLCLTTAFLLSLVLGGMPLLQRIARPHSILGLTRPLATLMFALVAMAFAALIWSYVVSDFSVLNVIQNSHTTKPMLYKIIGAWGNHEGSMLLWMLILAGCSFLVAILPAQDRPLKAMTLSVLGAISAGFLAFILFTSNPFIRVWPMPANGEDLNPILQDIGLAFHPPTLYVGYVGFGVVFAYAIAGMRLRRIDQRWAKTVQPWIMIPWTALTLGIAAGAWWAYHELGWGGWWFWDPVENVSLLPWLAGTALLHSNLVLEKRGQLARWVVLLAILAFSMSLIGTFIVRSGIITSVHAFASDPTRGMFILAYVFGVSGSALLLYGFTKFPETAPVQLLSRSGFMLINNVFLVAAAGIVLLAILFPLFMELSGGQSVSVGPDYFNATVLPMTAPLLPLAAIAPLLAWDRTRRTQLLTQLYAIAPAVLIAGVITMAIGTPRWAMLCAALALAGMLLIGAARYGHRQMRLRALGLRPAAALLAHLGLAVFVLGMAITACFKQTYEAPMGRDPIQLGRYTLQLVHTEKDTDHNFTAKRATFRVEKDGHFLAQLTPELRSYAVRQMQTSEAAIHTTPWRDVYLVLGETNYGKAGDLGIRLYITPAQQWIWIGFLMAAFGGALALLSALKRLFTEARR